MSRDYHTRADLCRAALKAANYSARQVSVKQGYRDAVVTIRDATIRRPAIVEIVAAVCAPERVYADGDQFTADTYRVDYLPEIVAPIADTIEALLVAAGPGRSVDTGIGRASWGDDGRSTMLPRDAEVWVRGSHYCRGVRWASERLAVEILSRGPADEWIDRLDLDEPAPTVTLGPDLGASVN